MEHSFLFLLIRRDDVVPRVASNLKSILQGGHLKEHWWHICRDGQRNLLASLPGSLRKLLNEFNFFACIIYEFPLLKNHYVLGNKIQSGRKLIAKERGSWSEANGRP